jgi:pimeloyl-ACP methyl ester carboxylesterase
MRALAAGLLVAASLTGCTTAFAPSESAPTMESVDEGLEPYYHQVLEWHGCEDGMQCATAIAPLDWAEPDGERIELALIRSEASGDRIGSLLVNPGGPGASGVGWLAAGAEAAVDERVSSRFDVVSFDPRGVGGSTPVTCYTDPADMDDYLFGLAQNETGTDAWFEEVDAAGADFAGACLENTGDLLGHVGTVDVARDLDMLRAALGDGTLHYLGYSYGTFVGAVYAELFPENTGRLVLDGAVDPQQSALQSVLGQRAGFESALRAYIDDCLTRDGCPFSGTEDDAIDVVAGQLDDLEQSPLRASDGRELGGDSMFIAIITPLYNEAYWEYLDQLFATVSQGDASVAFSLIDSYFERDPDGEYLSNFTEAFTATNCLDSPSRASVEETRAEVERVKDVSPLFGSDAGYAVHGCATWPFPPTFEPHPIAASGSADILVVGTTNDPATPYADAVSLADQLENGHLVSFTGEGHTAYNGTSSCVDDVVDAYLIDGDVPAEDPHC